MGMVGCRPRQCLCHAWEHLHVDNRVSCANQCCEVGFCMAGGYKGRAWTALCFVRMRLCLHMPMLLAGGSATDQGSTLSWLLGAADS